MNGGALGMEHTQVGGRGARWWLLVGEDGCGYVGGENVRNGSSGGGLTCGMRGA